MQYTGLVLCDFFLCDCALMQLENFYHFSNLYDNFCLNAIWCRRSMAALVFCRRLAESDITVTLSVTYGLITLEIQTHGSLSFLLNSIGYSYQHE